MKRLNGKNQARARLSAYALGAWVLGAGSALAQSAPDAGVLLQQQRALEQRAPALPESAPVLKAAQPGAASDASAVTVYVKGFRIVGELKSFSADELLAVVQPWVGRNLTVAQLQEAAQAVTAYYSQRGYFLARAYLVRQDVTEGVITLEVREGLLDSQGGVRVQGQALRIDPQQLEAIVRAAIAREPTLRLEHLERGILLLNDLPGISAAANLEPGRSAGSTRVVVDAKEGALGNGMLTADNYGSRYVGSQRLTASLLLNDPGQRADQFTLSATRALNGVYNYGAFGYSLPLGYEGWRLGLSVSDLSFGVGQELSSQNSKGTARTYGVNARYPLQRARAQSLWLNLGYDLKSLYNETAGTATSSKRVGVFNAGLGLDRVDSLWGGALNSGSLTFSSGVLDLSGNAANLTQDQGASGPHTSGSYSKLAWTLARQQQAWRDGVLGLSLAGQATAKNLDSSEKFQLGGPAGVRAYPTGEGLGDQGMRASLEARQRLGSVTPLGEIGFSGFYDWGRVTQYRNPDALGLSKPNTYELAGYGLGLSLSQPGRYDARLLWAHKAGGNPNQANGKDSDGTNESRRLWLMVTAYLN